MKEKLIILNLIIFSVLLTGCNNNAKSNNLPLNETQQNNATFKTPTELLNVDSAPNTCKFLSEENIKKWYNLEKVMFLTQPMGMDIKNSCNTSFMAKNLSTTVSVQLYDYKTIEDLKTHLEVIKFKDFENINGLGDVAFWDNGQNFMQKGLMIFYKGLKIVITQPAKDAYSNKEHKLRAIKIAQDFLAEF